jgi:hypothetical protein
MWACKVGAELERHETARGHAARPKVWKSASASFQLITGKFFCFAPREPALDFA